jgi:hypothetical protein
VILSKLRENRRIPSNSDNKQEVLGITNYLLSFDITRTTYKTIKLWPGGGGGADTPAPSLTNGPFPKNENNGPTGSKAIS